jgi:hypothetical protein
LNPPQLQLLVLQDLINALPNQSSFQCFKPKFSSTMNLKYPKDTCMNIEEGLAVFAQVDKIPANLHPIVTGETEVIPDCSKTGTCSFKGIKDDVIGEFLADTHGRWPQICDFYTSNLAQKLIATNIKCNAEGRVSCPKANEELRTYLNRIPCMCRWLYFSRVYASTAIFPSGFAGTSLLQYPRMYQCRTNSDGSQDCSSSEPSKDPGSSRKPAALPPSGCWRKHFHPFSMPEMKFVSSIWPKTDFYTEDALTTSSDDWWTRKHVLSVSEKAKFDRDNDKTTSTSCEQDENCWLNAALAKGNFSFLAVDCSKVAEAACFLKQMGNLTGLSVGCISTNPSFKTSLSDINLALYNGQYSKYGSKLQPVEYVGAYDLHNSAPGLLNVSVFYNDTTQVAIENSGGNPTPRSIRLSEPINAIVHAFLNADTGSAPIYAAMMGIREVRACHFHVVYNVTYLLMKQMPKIATFLTLDIGSALGPFFFTLAFNILFPTIVVSLVYEKEVVLMRSRAMPIQK